MNEMMNHEDDESRWWIKNLINWPIIFLQNSAEFQQPKRAYDTQYSQPVTHVSTNWARRSLTSEIGRDRVYSTWYGRKRYFFRLCININHTRTNKLGA